MSALLAVSFALRSRSIFLWLRPIDRGPRTDAVTSHASYRAPAELMHRFVPRNRAAFSLASVHRLQTTHRREDEVERLNVEKEERFVLSCAWCRRFAVGDGWVEPGLAKTVLGLDSARPPVVSHGLCADCESALVAGEAPRP